MARGRVRRHTYGWRATNPQRHTHKSRARVPDDERGVRDAHDRELDHERDLARALGRVALARGEPFDEVRQRDVERRDKADLDRGCGRSL